MPQTSARSSDSDSWTRRWPRWARTTSVRPRACSWSKVIGRRTPSRVGWSRPCHAGAQLPVRAGTWNVPGSSAGDQRELAREAQRRRDDPLDAVRREVERLAALLEVVAQARQALPHPPLLTDQRPQRPRVAEAALVERPPPAQHRLLDLRRDHRGRAAQVLADLLDLAHHAREEVEIALQGAVGRSAPRLPAGADAVVDEHRFGGLAVAVDAAIALLEAVRIPRDLRVREQVALALERDALRRRVGGQAAPAPGSRPAAPATRP